MKFDSIQMYNRVFCSGLRSNVFVNILDMVSQCLQIFIFVYGKCMQWALFAVECRRSAVILCQVDFHLVECVSCLVSMSAVTGFWCLILVAIIICVLVSGTSPIPPSGLRAHSIDSRSIELTWDPSPTFVVAYSVNYWSLPGE